jgi:hypothetical protein
MKKRVQDRMVHEVKLVDGIDRHTLEAPWLELRRLARKHGVEVDVRVERTAMPPSA